MNMFKKIKKILLKQKESKDVVSSLKEFNSITSSYISSLEQQVKQKEKRVSKIRVLVDKLLPKKKMESTRRLNIQLLDINDTKITETGKGSYKKSMDWEKNLRNFRQDNRGKVV